MRVKERALKLRWPAVSELLHYVARTRARSLSLSLSLRVWSTWSAVKRLIASIMTRRGGLGGMTASDAAVSQRGRERERVRERQDR